MITNIVASVVITLVTNVVQSDNTFVDDDPLIRYATTPVQLGKRVPMPATERYATTNVSEMTVVTFKIEGVEHTLRRERLVSSVTAVSKRIDVWVPAGVRTNVIPIEPFKFNTQQWITIPLR